MPKEEAIAILTRRIKYLTKRINEKYGSENALAFDKAEKDALITVLSEIDMEPMVQAPVENDHLIV